MYRKLIVIDNSCKESVLSCPHAPLFLFDEKARFCKAQDYLARTGKIINPLKYTNESLAATGKTTLPSLIINLFNL